MRFDPAEEEVCKGSSWFEVAVMVMLSTLAGAMVVILERGGKHEELGKEGRSLDGASLQVSKRVRWGSFYTCNVGLQAPLQRCQLDGLFVLIRLCDSELGELDAIPK